MLRELTVPLSGGDLAAVSLVLTELVTNAIRHGCNDQSDDLHVDLYRSDGLVRISVTQTGGLYDPDEIRLREPGNTRGWGLLILDRLCSGWGVDSDAHGVWAEMAVEP
jgi:two-component sensor histidine kinase